MTEVDRIIAGMSAVELVMFHAIGGVVPPARCRRALKLLAGVVAEQFAPLPPAYRDPGPPPKIPLRRGVWRRRRWRPRLRNAA